MNAKKNLLVLPLLLLCAHFVWSQTSVHQNAEVVENVTRTTYSGRSLIFTKGVTLKATTTSVFRVSAQQHGPFFIKPATAVKGVNNLPVSLDKNFVMKEVILEHGITTESQLLTLANDKKLVEYKYSDELGRSTQTILQGASPLAFDFVNFHIPEAPSSSLRKSFLPYSHSGQANGAYKENALSVQQTFYLNAFEDSHAFSQSTLESSPLDRVTESFGPGSEWHNNSKKTSAILKIHVSESIYFWNYNGPDVPPTLNTAHGNPSGTYKVNTVFFTETTDEGGHISRMYSDFLGRNILKEVKNDSEWLQTYSIYDSLNRVRFVLPPEASANISTYLSYTTDQERQNWLDKKAFQYVYDKWGRLVKKKVPGAAWSLYVYDRWDRLVLVKNNLSSNQWLFTKYDKFNRAVMTGIFVSNSSHQALQQTARNITESWRHEYSDPNQFGYTRSNSFPTAILSNNVFAMSYYDNYSFMTSAWNDDSKSYSYRNIVGYPQESEKLTVVKGYSTGSKVKVEDGSWLNSVIYYDKHYNVIQLITENYAGGLIITTNDYDFSGRIVKTHQENTFSSLVHEYFYTYDKTGRMLKVEHSIDGATPFTLLENKYNELGELIEKNVHQCPDGKYLQSLDYKYNIRGWLTHINNSALQPESGDDNIDLFGMEIQYNPGVQTAIHKYDNSTSTTTEKYYDGNISAIKWKTNTLENGVTPEEKIYGFKYDDLSRLENAYYGVSHNGTFSKQGWMFNEEISEFDRNGNIKKLTRMAGTGVNNDQLTTIDDLDYDYLAGNTETDQLVSIEDDTGNQLGFSSAPSSITKEFEYDVNGNLIYDHNKGISSITYNYFNLPTQIQFSRPDGQIDRIDYTYDALGTRLSKSIYINNNLVWRTVYSGIYQYDQNPQKSLSLTFFTTPEGRVVNNGAGFEYEHFLKDHLGNTRVVYGYLKETETYQATMEPSHASKEAAKGFKNIYAPVQTPSVNLTPASFESPVPNASSVVNAAKGKSVGPALFLQVEQGDAVYIDVSATYRQSITQSLTPFQIAALVSLLTSPAVFDIPNIPENTKLLNGFNNNAGVVAPPPAGSAVPKAYVAFLFFDNAKNFVRSGAASVTIDAFERWQFLELSFTATTGGYLYIYTAGETIVNGVPSSTPDVFFDEMHIVHQKNNLKLEVTQASDYYPFGLAFNEYSSDRLYVKSIDNNNAANSLYETRLRNRQKFQGQDYLTDLGLNWYSFEARNYAPTLGRWIGVDPLAGMFSSVSPYNFTLNNPLSLIDSDGRSPNPAYNLLPVYEHANQNAYKGWNNAYTSLTQHLSGASSFYENLWRPVANNWESNLNHLKGGSYQYVPWGSRAMSGEFGLGIQISSIASEIISGFFPGTGIAKSLLDAREGNYASAALNLGLALTEVGTTIKSAKAVRAIEKTSSKVSFYVTQEGVAIPGTAYRAIGRLPDQGIMSQAGPTYFTFNNIMDMTPSEIKEGLQLPYPPNYVASFNTLQIIDDIRIPWGNWNSNIGVYEPITSSFPNFGAGGFTQAVTSTPVTNYQLYSVYHPINYGYGVQGGYYTYYLK